MRRTTPVVAAAAAVTALVTALGGTPAAAATTAAENPYGDSAWEPAPSAPAEIPAGALCASPIRLEEPIDGVRGRVLATYPDGSPMQEEFVGPLTVQVTNLDTGAATTVNASGHALLVEYHLDGSQTWNWVGPVVMGFRAGRANNHATGLYLLTGKYSAELTATGRTITSAQGTERDLCAEIA
jgi:hypothetical protein